MMQTAVAVWTIVSVQVDALVFILFDCSYPNYGFLLKA